MTLDRSKAILTGRIWQSIAQSGVSISALPKEQLDVLINAIADGVLVAMDEVLGEIGAAEGMIRGDQAMAAASSAAESLLWSGCPFLSLAEYYEVTNERIRIQYGLLRRDHENIELTRIQDIDYTQNLTERMVNIGDIVIRSADASNLEVTLRNVAHPDHVHEIIRKAVLNARQRHRVGLREEI